MTCSEYYVDISGIETELKKVKDNGIKDQIIKKIKKVKANPTIGEKKKYNLKDEYAVKVNHQRMVIFYHIEEDCIIVFDLFERHDQGYRNTF